MAVIAGIPTYGEIYYTLPLLEKRKMNSKKEALRGFYCGGIFSG